MTLKLFNVDVRSFVVVLAKDRKEAEKFVEEEGMGISSSDILQDAEYYAREITLKTGIDPYWKDLDPFISDKYSDDKDYNDIANLTCGEIMDKWTEEEKERLRKIAEEERFDRVQMKFNFS